jgi:hypothetical protein
VQWVATAYSFGKASEGVEGLGGEFFSSSSRWFLGLPATFLPRAFRRGARLGGVLGLSRFASYVSQLCCVVFAIVYILPLSSELQGAWGPTKGVVDAAQQAVMRGSLGGQALGMVECYCFQT